MVDWLECHWGGCMAILPLLPACGAYAELVDTLAALHAEASRTTILA